MSDALENKANQLPTVVHTDGSTEFPPAKPAELSARQERFCELYAAGQAATDAYEAAYCSSSRMVARTNAIRLLRNPKVTQRVAELQNAAASLSMRSTAVLIRELEEMCTAEVAELMRLDVHACRRCWGKGQNHREREPNPECRSCDGAGLARVKFASTADVSPGARRLLRGIELFPDGSVKRVLLHDQAQLRIELHRLRGLHVDRSLTVNVNANVPALGRMTREEQLAFLESLRPVP
ncbi:MAG: terminase small subunit [Steroidobacteraceae bacterium]